MIYLQKTAALATMIAILAPTAHAGAIREGTSGYAAKIVNGQEVLIAETTHVGLPPAKVNDPGYRDMPDDFLTFNPGTVAKVNLDSQTFINSRVGESVPLNLLGNQWNAKVTSKVTHDNGDVSWIAATTDQENAIITFGVDGTVVGSAHVDGVAYSISTDAYGNTWLVNLTDSGQTPGSLQHDQLVPANAVGSVATVTADMAEANLVIARGKIATNSVEQNATNALKVGNLTTSDASANVASVLVYVANTLPGYQTVVNFLVETTNQAYFNSGVNLKLKLAGVIPVVDPYPNSDTNTLTALYQASGVFKNIAAQRAAANADFVVMLHAFQQAQGICGVSYINGYGGSQYYKALTVASVSYGQQGNEYCNDWTFAHELGHSMGMVHDAGDGGTPTSGHYIDAMGYGLKGVYGDIMSYYPQVGLFSSPGLLWRYNASTTYPLGQTGVANVVRGLNVSAPQIINFHSLLY